MGTLLSHTAGFFFARPHALSMVVPGGLGMFKE